MFGKKGLSAVVATVSLVLLTFAAVVVVSSFIIPLVRENLNEGTECSAYKDYFAFEEEFGYNCYNGTSGDWLNAVSIGAGSVSQETEEKVKGFRLSFLNAAGESEVIGVSSDSEDYGEEFGQIRRINASLLLEVPGSGEIRTYVYRSIQNFEIVQVSPELKSGRVCPKSDSIRIEGFICEKVLTVR